MCVQRVCVRAHRVRVDFCAWGVIIFLEAISSAAVAETSPGRKLALTGVIPWKWRAYKLLKNIEFNEDYAKLNLKTQTISVAAYHESARAKFPLTCAIVVKMHGRGCGAPFKRAKSTRFTASPQHPTHPPTSPTTMMNTVDYSCFCAACRAAVCLRPPTIPTHAQHRCNIDYSPPHRGPLHAALANYSVY